MGVITADGYQIKTYEQYYEEIKNELLIAFPNMTTLDTNPLIIFAKKNADLLSKISLMGLDVYNARAVSTANCTALDFVVNVIGVYRKTSTFSNGNVLFSGVNGTTIPNGTIVESNQGVQYRTVTDATIDATGTTNVEIISILRGSQSWSTANTVNVLPLPIVGVSSLTNPIDIVNGRDTETDPELRQRWFKSLGSYGRSTIPALLYYIAGVEGVSLVSLIENDSHMVSLSGQPGHSIALYVTGGLESDVIDAIYTTKGGGIRAYGNIEGFRGPYDQYKIQFSRHSTENISFSVEIKPRTTYWDNSFIDAIKNEMVNNLSVDAKNGEINFSFFLDCIYSASGLGVETIRNFKFTINGVDYGYGDSVPFAPNEIPVINFSDISITTFA
ncbi:MAG: baseplate J/gp47 family protein [Fusobacteriaceae bacterium]